MESLLSRMTRGQLEVAALVLLRLQEAADAVARLASGGEGVPVYDLIRNLEQSAVAVPEPIPRELTPPAIEARPRFAPPAAGTTIRLSAERLDALLLKAEDLLGLKLAASERVREVAALGDALRVPGFANGSGLHRADGAEERGSHGRQLALRARRVLEQARTDERMIHATVDDVLDELRRLRMLPASSILDPFPRMVRDLAREQEKDVEWSARGADLLVDRKVLEAVKDPLIHLVRNAIDHGLEPPNVRVAQGKSRAGRVTLSIASYEGNRIEVVVEDDGRGIDLAEVRAAAVRARILSPNAAESVSDEEALAFVYRSGLSTSRIITDVSGHGLGLAIVKERVESLGGVLALDTRKGGGTAVRMTLPATVATFRGLLVSAAGQSFFLPTEAVEQVIRVPESGQQTIDGREVVTWRGQPLFAASLGALLGLAVVEPAGRNGRYRLCVVISAGDQRTGLFVDEITTEQEVPVKELLPPLVRVRNVMGAGLLGTGDVVLILRPTDLVEAVLREVRSSTSTAVSPRKRSQPSVLVVDDSITTRTMERNLLEAAGYRVRVAVDGMDGWTLLKSEKFDLVVSDVDMPRMSGFDLTARIRADEKLMELPVVLVTALESRDDKERGIEVGANAYVVKSSFDQSNLLEIIQRLL
jgi:two-component system chemotaxis sensor kinase CheA